MNREPNALDALAHVGRTVARFGCGLIFFACIALAWVGTP